MSNPKKNFQLLFDRPLEPLITPKGENKSLFQLTEKHLPDEYKENGLSLNNRFGEDASELIPLQDLKRVPQFRKAKRLSKYADLCLFNETHQEMAAEVIDEMMAVPQNDLQQLLSLCAYCRANLNSQLFNYAMSVALLHRRDTRDVPIPNFAETFPSKFLDSKVFTEAREIAAVTPTNSGTRATAPVSPLIIPRDFTATDLEVEHRLAYFREDIGVNLHHWHWHLVYPFNANDISIVNKDRRGELFFYMHQQIIARYNADRFCNKLARVKKFGNYREVIPEAYYPKLDSLTSARGYPPRQANMQWRNVNRQADGLTRSVADVERWTKNINEAIATGQVRMPNGSTQPLTIDMLGNMMEASILSVNRDFYGDLHNTGHILTAYIHDPEQKYLESNSVMADEAITMRDPFFYRWHANIDEIFQSFKESQNVRRYTRSELDNNGVRITGFSINSNNSRRPNELTTFWMRSDVELSRGLDFSFRAPVYVRFTHLNHRDFTYNIQVNNTGNATRTTVRIFLAPKLDERNQTWSFNNQRRMFIEMDRFVTELRPGNNMISRQSTQSSVTIPFEATFRDLSYQGSNPRDESLRNYNFCGCGWPQHMLIPKGSAGGVTFQMFIMCSNYEMDRVDQPDGAQMSCDDASSFCGLQDRLYPDRRSMGYPFDRPSDRATTLEEFLSPNMAVQDVVITHQNVTEDNPRNPQRN